MILIRILFKVVIQTDQPPSFIHCSVRKIFMTIAPVVYLVGVTKINVVNDLQ